MIPRSTRDGEKQYKRKVGGGRKPTEARTVFSADGCMNKAPMAKESSGRNPTDRGKKEQNAIFL